MSCHNPVIADKIIAQAVSHLGEHEIGDTNTGVLPDRALEYVGDAPGNPWCAAFACLIVFLAGVTGGPKTGSSGALVEWAREHGRLVSVPRRGDLGCERDASSPTGYCHTVICEHDFGGGDVETIEGNYGNAVKRNTRPVDGFTWLRPY